MPRKPKTRQINFQPRTTYFKPQGVPLSSLKEVINLNLDELEAIRLVDLRELNQIVAAREMAISQSTLQRTLTRARRKIAQALINGWAIEIKGGEITMVGFGRGQGGRRGRMGGAYIAGPGGACVCTNPDCQNELPHQVGTPCYQVKCPKCGSPMIRKR